MKSLSISVLAAALIMVGGCKTTKPDPSINPPTVSTATVGQDLTKLGTSISSAQDSVKGVRGNLSEVDAKAVRIQEYIRNW